ncbi:MAG: CBS domain-containing protein [Gammaproteobacteria bacterium]|nr:CBS domain-containing protein [Gammaproteobacteria bacterium]TVQ49369.1 MAG: CBS domain-containing protein [Gammaproteobacteria bacterium]
MHSVRDILKHKNGELWSVAPGESVLEAVREMARRGVGALLVMQDGHLEGILSERDYARKVILQGRRSESTTVGEIMSRQVISIHPDTMARQGLELMTQKFIRHLPVLEDGRVVGVVSIGDLVKSVIQEQQSTIEELERYVTG